MIEPFEIVDSGYFFRPLPAGLQPGPFDPGIPDEFQRLIEVIRFPVVQNLQSDSEAGCFHFPAGSERHVADIFELIGKTVPFGIEQQFLVFPQFAPPDLVDILHVRLRQEIIQRMFFGF